MNGAFMLGLEAGGTLGGTAGAAVDSFPANDRKGKCSEERPRG